jgi:hypothetical protein
LVCIINTTTTGRRLRGADLGGEVKKEMVKTERVVLLAATVIILVTGLSVVGLSRAQEDAHTRGYYDAIRDYHGKGYDPSCPSGHSAAYCANYQSGYGAGWHVTQGVLRETKEQQGYWTLTVSLRGVPTDLSIYVQALAQSGQTVGTTPSGMSVVTLQMPQSEFPRGESYTIGIWKPGGLGSWQQFLFLSTG